MALPLTQLPFEVLREIRARKWLAFLVFAAVSFGVLGVGFLYPYQYQSEVVIYVDDQNIIRPLMQGSAVTTEINQRASAAEELLWSRKVLEPIARDASIFGPETATLTKREFEERLNRMRSNLFVRTRGDSYFGIGYESTSAERSFRLAQRLGQAFIAESAERKREESRNAYDFIDKQVKSYERELEQSEARLKEFLSTNVDGTEEEANKKIASLRGKLELARLERQELQTRVQSLERQLQGVSPTLRQEKTRDAYKQRITTMQEQLDQLRLKYHDSYPDIVILKEQIAELKKQRESAAEQGTTAQSTEGEDVMNPLYQELSASLSDARTNIEAIDTRINSLNQLLAEQRERMKRIQKNKAEYSELTRDMEVNKEIYNDLLKRREKARVSMHLDVEGQGLNFDINESAQYPLGPSGLKFSYFAAAGLLLGIVAPFGAVGGLLHLDPRVRGRSQLEKELGLMVIGEVPEVRTPFERRRDRRRTVGIIFCCLLVAAAYIAVAGAVLLGVI
ncbi:polysaccharide chain length determinant protein (PEP-CTERM system associated) [Tamilnaduibacter salinus]|uniref:Lipopolysaccharide biosynthesis protein n=1 Tax=Tamilnaduibacter salinus TaxID=1484056 RepID=A0A2A2I645_9GAMM|nr:XrtA system polysaccharide chain length determinant [Tamilnaduibacter salinus]PAV27052.1 lipopolysaccharide biosynthesis protein [Tamilnaduibacter salinus]PVY78327.1 polysaccharide chain length determinant protein (PEP-CTERM system associated) [Tamilnaduibacter salinus]